ncbi:hypothetical protein ACVIGB_008389 [Bradyrhizobium sp. USDA 4341]
MPEHIQQFLLMPIADQLLSEMQDVCSSDCPRMSLTERSALTDDKDEIDDYWLRLEPDGLDEPGDRRTLRREFFNEPCAVGFPVDNEAALSFVSLRTERQEYRGTACDYRAGRGVQESPGRSEA